MKVTFVRLVDAGLSLILLPGVPALARQLLTMRQVANVRIEYIHTLPPAHAHTMTEVQVYVPAVLAQRAYEEIWKPLETAPAWSSQDMVVRNFFNAPLQSLFFGWSLNLVVEESCLVCV